MGSRCGAARSASGFDDDADLPALPESLADAVPGAGGDGAAGTLVDGLTDAAVTLARATAVQYALVSQMFAARQGERRRRLDELCDLPRSEQAELISGRVARFTDEWSLLIADVSAGFCVGEVAASTFVETAIVLRTRLRRLWDLLARGLATVSHIRKLVEAADLIVDDPVAVEFDRRVAEQIEARMTGGTGRGVLTVGDVLDLADRVLAELDPDARLRENKQHKVHIVFRGGRDGMEYVSAAVDRTTGMFWNDRADEVARTVCRKDGRSLDQRRVDAITMLLKGYVTLGCRCERSDCDKRTPQPHAGVFCEQYQVVVHLIENRSTFEQGDDLPAFVEGSGPIPAAEARDIIEQAGAVKVRPFGTPIPEHTPSPEQTTIPEPAPTGEQTPIPEPAVPGDPAARLADEHDADADADAVVPSAADHLDASAEQVTDSDGESDCAAINSTSTSDADTDTGPAESPTPATDEISTDANWVPPCASTPTVPEGDNRTGGISSEAASRDSDDPPTPPRVAPTPRDRSAHISPLRQRPARRPESLGNTPDFGDERPPPP